MSPTEGGLRALPGDPPLRLRMRLPQSGLNNVAPLGAGTQLFKLYQADHVSAVGVHGMYPDIVKAVF
jgi:hypothetical protein